MDLSIGVIATAAGLMAAVVLFALVWHLVTRARTGNRRVREARGDPHAEPGRSHTSGHDRRRDIPQ